MIDNIKILKWYKIALLTYKMLAVCPKYAKLIIMYTAKEQNNMYHKKFK